MAKFCCLLVICLLLLPAPAFAQELELEDGRWFTLYDSENNVLLRTGIRIHVGDRFLDSDNRMYRVYKVDNRRLRAWAELVEAEGSLARSVPAQGLEGTDARRIALYHTHSGESYQPSDGVDSTDQTQGGVYKVGAQFTQRLEAQDTLEVVHCQQTFFPYQGSYRRSRTAVLDFIEEDFDAIFDLHRDAAPWQEYYREIGDQELTQVMLVVGTQNPNYRVNEEFAWLLKETADAMYPDLVKGIFYARGDYNQDLHPRALLLEVGAHTNSRSHAETGAGLFAEVVYATMYGRPQNGDSETEAEIEENPQLQSTSDPPAARKGGLLKGVLTLMGLLAVGGSFFLFISVGSWAGVKEKLVEFKNNEFRDVLARIPWEKLRLGYILAQFKEIKVGKGSLTGLPGQLKEWWDRLRNRTRI